MKLLKATNINLPCNDTVQDIESINFLFNIK